MQLAQVNVARMKASLESALMAGFVARLDEINALADQSAGFVWRLKADEDNAVYLRPFDDDRILFNLSVWDSIEALRAYVYGGGHLEVLRRRREWFSRFEQAHLALWWIQAGHRPSVEEAKSRLEHLVEHGPTPFAFTMSVSFPPDRQHTGMP